MRRVQNVFSYAQMVYSQKIIMQACVKNTNYIYSKLVVLNGLKFYFLFRIKIHEMLPVIQLVIFSLKCLMRIYYNL